ncbi:hypothetical protein [Bradyrhizobium sp. CCGUVB23]|uniref:hypothetical protein n=1 Tax=Bradyrhizobium sp. CCGUVB23 TaxID=2949630 RepID=UPI0020B242B1|nr:hypothetical protein [Bradyrhizobium sp. CCGUVB23]MCP3468259.1 hypothetical protein [Bradyrhizobium sp. CCGUVB23]
MNTAIPAPARERAVSTFEKANIHAERFDEYVSGLHEDVMKLRGRAIGPIDLLRLTAKKRVVYHAV